MGVVSDRVERREGQAWWAFRRSERRIPVHVYTPEPHYGRRVVDVWRYRALTRYFGKLYVQRRYRRALLGWLWLPLRPTADVLGRVLLFGGLLGVASGTRPYFMYYIVGATAWRFFSMGLLMATRSLEMNRSLFAKVDLPRSTAVVAAVIPAAVDAGSFVLIGLAGSVYFKLTEGSFYLFVGAPSLVAAAGVLLLAAYVVAFGLWMAPLAFRARDVRFLLTYALGLWYVVTPVIYPITSIPQSFRPIAVYNPITAPVDLIKYGTLATSAPPSGSIVVSLAVLAFLLVGGFVVFLRAEAKMRERV